MDKLVAHLKELRDRRHGLVLRPKERLVDERDAVHILRDGAPAIELLELRGANSRLQAMHVEEVVDERLRCESREQRGGQAEVALRDL